MFYVVSVYTVTCIVRIHGDRRWSKYRRSAPQSSTSVRVSLRKAPAFVSNFDKASP